MGMFAGKNMNKRKGGEGGGPYFDKTGWYLVEILRNKQSKTPDAVGGKPFFASEMKIIESTNPERAPGTPCNFFKQIDKFPESDYGDIADFMRAALCCKLAEVTKGQVVIDPKKVVGTDKDPLDNDETADKFGTDKDETVGVRMRLYAHVKPQKKDPTKSYTRHYWFVPQAMIDTKAVEKDAE